MSCHRRYFFEHILGWRLDVPAHDLYFGECWHRGRQYQLINGYGDIEGAYSTFENHYRKVFPAETDAIYLPKTPTSVLHALIKFSEERANDLVENEVVIINGSKMTEISGTVPIDENRVLHYRMDSIMRRVADGKIFSWDHKTTHEKYISGYQWAEAFYLGIQNGTYTHCLYCMFPIEDVLGVEFCGTGFTYLKKGSKDRPAGYHTKLRRVPAFKTPEQMNVWLWNTIDILNDVEREMDRLFHCREDDTVMMSFQMNPKSCTDYRGCPYHDFCLSWTNPLQQCYEPPLGFREEFWNPAEKESTNKLNLEWGK
jgi:hypothetical protein